MDRDDDAGSGLEDIPSFHQRIWRLQRVGWIAMLLVALAGLVGLLGPGSWSRTRVEHPAGLRVEHTLFARAETQQAMDDAQVDEL